MTARSLSSFSSAVLAAAFAAAACPEIDFQNHSFACTLATDCLFTAGEECIEGHCVKCPEGGCAGPDAGAPDAGKGCAAESDCSLDETCVAAGAFAHCIHNCLTSVNCGGLTCKLAKAISGAYDPVCAQAGAAAVGTWCGTSDDCVSAGSCIESACRETCSPEHTTCANTAQKCGPGTGFPVGWGYCQ